MSSRCRDHAELLLAAHDTHLGKLGSMCRKHKILELWHAWLDVGVIVISIQRTLTPTYTVLAHEFVYSSDRFVST